MYIQYVLNVFVLLTYSTLAKSLTCPAAVYPYHSLSPVFITWETTVEGGRGGTWEAPEVRDETHWQAQVIELNTFGALKSHRHPVVIHQHMCWNVSPSLNIVSVGVRLMHGSFSLVHVKDTAGWLCKHSLTHTSASMSYIYISLYPAGDFVLQKNGNWAPLVWPICNA